MRARNWVVCAAFGWLVLTGLSHFVIDVAYDLWRGGRAPGNEATLFYGLHSAYALGKLAFGLLGLAVARHALPLLTAPSTLVLSLLAGLGWLAVAILFIEYRQPTNAAAIFCGLILVSLMLPRRPAP